MATIVLQIAGSAIGSLLGGPVGAAIGSAIGATAGNYIDRSLMSGGAKHYEGPRLKSLNGISATEGSPIPRLYGRARIGGQVIWATKLEEVSTRQKVKTGGKGGQKQPTQTTYSYFANVAIGLCEGQIAFVRRVWADGNLLDLSTVTMRVYRGTETQQPDPLIIAKQGRADMPGFRGLAYVVFERLPLENYGNRLPVLTFEVVRPVDGIGQLIRAVDIIPGSTEFGYETQTITRYAGLGVSNSENRNQTTHTTDFKASLDALQALCPNLQNVALVVSWFGSDLRAGSCNIQPKVDLKSKATAGADWSVAGLSRASATEISKVNGRSSFGGTPSDASVIHAITELKSRGLNVLLYPFIMMDIPAGNNQPDPVTGAMSQPAYPWRGRITCTAAVDGTAAAEQQVANFFGLVKASDFGVSATSFTGPADWSGDGNDGSLLFTPYGLYVPYFGPSEWSFRRHILHCAALARAAGGVDSFLIGSELIGLTRVRGASGNFPSTSQLIQLAAEARIILGATTKIGYAADWTEYGACSRNNGTELRFPLDPLWANSNINFIGIDFYPPLTDWRDGRDHKDAQLANAPYDSDYLASRFHAGEAYDWYYASDADRIAQARTPITDGAFQKPWVYRVKDLAGWWSNPHFERTNGQELATPTAWQAQSKPIWLTEFGVPATDKGTNAPNVFPDPKSAEAGLPPFSRGNRDDLIQSRAIDALYRNFDASHPFFVAGNNPSSTVYNGPMIDPSRIYIWAWDARPFPAFPHSLDVWSDGLNWITGHWLNGRIEGAPLDRLIAKIMKDFDLGAAGFSNVDGFVDGYVIDRPMAARAALETLLLLHGVDAIADAGAIRFAGRKSKPVATLQDNDFVPDRQGMILHQSRAQETELPHEISLNFIESSVDFRSISVSSRRLAGKSKRESRMEAAIMLPRELGQRLVDISLQESWIGRDLVEFSLRPGLLALQIGDVILLGSSQAQRLFRIIKITDGLERKVSAKAVEPSLYDAAGSSGSLLNISASTSPGPAFAVILDLPAANGTPTGLEYLAVHADPWPGSLVLWRSNSSNGYDPLLTISQSATVGKTLTDLAPGPVWRWDRGNSVTVQMAGGYLYSLDATASLAGGNTIAIRGANSAWEIFSFANATLVSTDTWKLSGLIRGLKGSEMQAANLAPAGSTVVLLDEAVIPVASGIESLGQNWTYRLAPADRDYADPSAISLTSKIGTFALQPLSPVQLKAVRGGAGIAISWIRRTRINGDTWDLSDVPLSETQESYQLDILNGNLVTRSLILPTASYIYPSALELADFGKTQTTLTLLVRQISSEVGPGAALTQLVNIG